MNTQDQISTGICNFFGYPEFFKFTSTSEGDEEQDNRYWEEKSGLVSGIKSLGGLVTEREMIRMIYPRVTDDKLSEAELIEALFPSIDGYVDAVLAAVFAPTPYFPLEWGTLTVGFCVKDGLLHAVHTYQTRPGLVFQYFPVSLDRSWDAEVLLVEAVPF